jgi:hypothetical protein
VESPFAAIERGLIFQRSGRLREAESAYREALKAAPENFTCFERSLFKQENTSQLSLLYSAPSESIRITQTTKVIVGQRSVVLIDMKRLSPATIQPLRWRRIILRLGIISGKRILIRESPRKLSLLTLGNWI